MFWFWFQRVSGLVASRKIRGAQKSRILPFLSESLCAEFESVCTHETVCAHMKQKMDIAHRWGLQAVKILQEVLACVERGSSVAGKQKREKAGVNQGERFAELAHDFT